MRNTGPQSAGVWTYTEFQYKFVNGKLRLKYPSIDEYFPVTSFAWKQWGVEFQISSGEIFPYYSSLPAILTYRKI